MQVDPSPMNVGDGGAVSRGSDSHTRLLESMVGNPQQTLPPDLRGDLPHSQQNNLRTSSDCKMPGVCSEPSKATSNSNHCSEVPPPQPLNSAPVFGSGALNAPLPDRPKVPDVKADGTGMCHTHHWPCGKTVGPEDLMNLVHSGVTANKKTPHSAGSAQPVISLPSGFQCSTLFKPGQQVAYVPSPGFTSPLCKITLPPGLGQIAALREATACQFQKDCPSKSSGSSLAPRHKSYPYQFSMGRGVASEKKLSKSRTDYTSTVKACKAEQKAALPSAASQGMALPVQQAPQAAVPLTHYTISPTAAICCSSALANITQSRLLSLVEKCPQYRAVEKASVAYLKPKTPSSTEEHVAPRSPEVRDVPLDLSSKSKRQKGMNNPQSSSSTVTEHSSVEAHQKSTLASKRLQATPYSATNKFSVLPENQRNGSSQRAVSKLANHTVEASAPWGKGSPQEPIGNLPGTYVGVASPILASTLRSKDGKGASFVEDLQTFAKQEPISIVDQGEQMISRGKKVPHTVKGAPQNKALKHSGGPRSPGAQELAASPLFATANSPSPRKSLGKAGMLGTSSVIKSLWKQSLSQGVSVQKRANQPSTKVKSSLNSENLMFPNSELNPANQEEETWETMKSPLSNLESIVKQKTLETGLLTTEHYAHLPGSRKSEGSAFLGRGLKPPSKQNLASGFTPSRASETSDFHSPSTNDAIAVRRLSADAGSRDKASRQCDALQSAKEDLSLSTPKKRSTNNRSKKDKGAEDLRQPAVQSEAVSQSSASSGPDAERKVNGAKEEEELVSETAAADETKQKKPKRPGKKKNSDLQRATSTPTKKQSERKSAAGRDEDPAEKKKEPSPPVENTLARKSVGKGPESGGQRHKRRSSNSDRDTSPLTRAQADKPSLHRHAPEHAPPIAESEPDEEFTPRKKRGRRRTDEALLRDWSFASPPTPPPPPPPPPSNPPSSSPPSPLLPPRRPRGRPRLNRQPDEGVKIKAPQGAKSKDDSSKKRKRCSTSRYQNGAYEEETDKVNEEQEVKSSAAEEETDVQSRLGTTLPFEVPSSDRSPKKSLISHLNTAHTEDSPTLDCEHKPPGKRKFKSKHLCDTEEHKKLKLKQGVVGKRAPSLCSEEESPAVKKPCSPVRTDTGPTSPSSRKKGAGKSITPEPTPSRPVPPEVRRLIVNKNAGETLLQRAARLGYQEVVLYCLEKDVREVNRRDNAGYTALHEACAHGCTHIVQVLLKHGADVNCSAQDGTRPIHDAVAADNLAAVWMLLNHGADPTLATYSGQTPVKLAQSANMKSFLKEYFSDLEGRGDQDPDLRWEFYSSRVFETDQEACWDFLLSNPEEEEEKEEGENEEKEEKKEEEQDCLVFEFSEEPLLPCYHIQISLSQGFCNWFLLMDVLKRLKVSSRIFRARYPQFEVVRMTRSELWKQVSISQTTVPPSELCPTEANEEEEEEGQEEEAVELVRCIPELQELLGSSIQLLREDEDEEVKEEERTVDSGRSRVR